MSVKPVLPILLPAPRSYQFDTANSMIWCNDESPPFLPRHFREKNSTLDSSHISVVYFHFQLSFWWSILPQQLGWRGKVENHFCQDGGKKYRLRLEKRWSRQAKNKLSIKAGNMFFFSLLLKGPTFFAGLAFPPHFVCKCRLPKRDWKLQSQQKPCCSRGQWINLLSINPVRIQTRQ